MFETTENKITVVTKPNFFIKLLAYVFLPLGLLLLIVAIWSLVKGQSLDVQIVLTCLTCLLFGGYCATVLKTRSYTFDRQTETIAVGWGNDVQTIQFDDLQSLECYTNVNWVTIRILSKGQKSSSIYVFPHNETSRLEGIKLLNALSKMLKLEPKLDSGAEKWFSQKT